MTQWWVLINAALLWPYGVALAADLSTHTKSLLAAAVERHASATAEDRRAADRLMRSGDIAYRRADFHGAWRNYSNAYPNAPTPRAYIMSGDTHWRGVLIWGRKSAPDAAGCRLDNQDFVHRLTQSLDQEYQLGLELMRALNDRDLLRSPLHKRAKRSQDCLRTMAQRYSTLPRSACVDLAELQACLGPPLPLPTR